MKKSIGSIQCMTLQLEKPLKLNIDKMTINSLCLFVGQNGTGKTLVLILQWVTSMMSNAIAVTRAKGLPLDKPKFFQELLDRSFSKECFDGKIEVYYENATLTAVINNGIVESVSLDNDEVTPNGNPIFMSKDTRLFTSYVQYMKLKKMLAITTPFQETSPENIEKILGMYKIYDALFMENMLDKLHNFILPDKLKKTIKDDFDIKHDIHTLIVDTEASDIFFINEKQDVKTSISTLSSGEQALLNMTFATVLANT